MSERPRPGATNPPVDRSGTLIEPVGPAPARHEDRSGTMLETDEDLRQALLAGIRPHRPVAQAAAPPPAQAPAPAPAPSRSASPFRPTARPPLPTLTVYDDGKSDGEVIRIRDARYVIGRTEGDLRIPLDGRVSSKHVEITLQSVGGLHRWVVTDLQSTHGMFVRVSRTPLADRAEFLVGTGRYLFDSPQPVADATADFSPTEAGSGETRGWDSGPSPYRPPALTELIGNEIGNRLLLVKPEYWIGTDPSCPICRPDDPFSEPKHARLFRGQKGGWHVEHNRTQNGLWLRMTQIVAESMIQFQVGEQRFRLKVD